MVAKKMLLIMVLMLFLNMQVTNAAELRSCNSPNGFTAVDRTCDCEGSACAEGYYCYAGSCNIVPKCRVGIAATLNGCNCGVSEGQHLCEAGTICQNDDSCAEPIPGADQDSEDTCNEQFNGDAEACEAADECYWNNGFGDMAEGCYTTLTEMVEETDSTIDDTIIKVAETNDAAIGLGEEATVVENAIERVEGNMENLGQKIGIVCKDRASEGNCDSEEKCVWAENQCSDGEGAMDLASEAFFSAKEARDALGQEAAAGIFGKGMKAKKAECDSEINVILRQGQNILPASMHALMVCFHADENCTAQFTTGLLAYVEHAKDPENPTKQQNFQNAGMAYMFCYACDHHNGVVNGDGGCDIARALDETEEEQILTRRRRD